MDKRRVRHGKQSLALPLKECFFVKHKKDLANHFFETVMLGSKEEYVRFIASITVHKPGLESSSLTHFAKHASHPRPQDLKRWGDVGLLMTGGGHFHSFQQMKEIIRVQNSKNTPTKLRRKSAVRQMSSFMALARERTTEPK